MSCRLWVLLVASVSLILPRCLIEHLTVSFISVSLSHSAALCLIQRLTVSFLGWLSHSAVHGLIRVLTVTFRGSLFGRSQTHSAVHCLIHRLTVSFIDPLTRFSALLIYYVSHCLILSLIVVFIISLAHPSSQCNTTCVLCYLLTQRHYHVNKKHTCYYINRSNCH